MTKSKKPVAQKPRAIDDNELDGISGGPAFMKLGDIKGDVVSPTTTTSINTSLGKTIG